MGYSQGDQPAVTRVSLCPRLTEDQREVCVYASGEASSTQLGMTVVRGPGVHNASMDIEPGLRSLAQEPKWRTYCHGQAHSRDKKHTDHRLGCARPASSDDFISVPLLCCQGG